MGLRSCPRCWLQGTSHFLKGSRQASSFSQGCPSLLLKMLTALSLLYHMEYASLPPVASSVDSAFLFSGFTLGLFIPFQVIPLAQLDLGPSSMIPGPDLVLRVIPKSSIIILGFPLCSHPFSPWAPRTPTTLKHILNGLPL